MRALQLNALEGPDALELTDLPDPALADGMVLIDVHAAGVGFVDLLMTRGAYQIRSEPPFVPGGEVAGVVRAAPEGSRLREGDRVVAATLLGGFAESVLAPEQVTFPLPDTLSFEEGAGLLINYHTAVFALARRGRLRPGDTVVVHGAAGGTGTAAVQVARGLGAANAIGVVSNETKGEIALAARASAVVMASETWVDEVRGLTSGRGADIVFDPVGGDRFDQSLRVLAPEGRILVVGFTDGRIPEVAVNRVLLRNVDVVGVNWGGFLAADPGAAASEAEQIRRLAEAGHVRPLVGSARPLAEGADALREIDARTATGKVVLRVR